VILKIHIKINILELNNMVRTEGKKESIRHLEEDIPTAKNYICLECKSELVKLETLTGSYFENNKEYYYFLYWICMCSKCGKKYKVIDSTLKREEFIGR